MGVLYRKKVLRGDLMYTCVVALQKRTMRDISLGAFYVRNMDTCFRHT